MGCVRDPGREGLAAGGKLLCEVDRCREPSKMFLPSQPVRNPLSHALATASGLDVHFSHVWLRRPKLCAEYGWHKSHFPILWNVI